MLQIAFAFEVEDTKQVRTLPISTYRPGHVQDRKIPASADNSVQNSTVTVGRTCWACQHVGWQHILGNLAKRCSPNKPRLTQTRIFMRGLFLLICPALCRRSCQAVPRHLRQEWGTSPLKAVPEEVTPTSAKHGKPEATLVHLHLLLCPSHPMIGKPIARGSRIEWVEYVVLISGP